jgi:hypothetical protein
MNLTRPIQAFCLRFPSRCFPPARKIGSVVVNLKCPGAKKGSAMRAVELDSLSSIELDAIAKGGYEVLHRIDLPNIHEVSRYGILFS